MKLERIILTGLYCEENAKNDDINKRAISIPLDSTYHQVWAPNGYGKTLALKILSKLRFPAPESEDQVPWETAFMGELRNFFRQPMTTDPDLIRGRDGESPIPYFDDIYGKQTWEWSEQLQVLPFHTLYAIFIDIENDIRYILEWDIKIFMDPEKSIGYSITEIKNAKKIPFLLEKEIDGESYSVPTIDIVNEVNKLSKVYPDEVHRYDSELFIERPSAGLESQIFDRIEDCRAILSNFTLGYYETLDIISDPLNWFTFSHDILIQINKLKHNEELTEDLRKLFGEFIEQWMEEINDRINEGDDPWSRELGKWQRNYVFWDKGGNQVEPETLSNGQRSVVTIETLLLLARVRAHLNPGEDVSYAMVIDEPETGLAEYWVDRLIERFRDIQYEFEANQIEGFSLIILTHRKRIRDESPIHDDESKYCLMQPYHPETLFGLYDFEDDDDDSDDRYDGDDDDDYQDEASIHDFKIDDWVRLRILKDFEVGDWVEKDSYGERYFAKIVHLEEETYPTVYTIETEDGERYTADDDDLLPIYEEFFGRIDDLYNDTVIIFTEDGEEISGSLNDIILEDEDDGEQPLNNDEKLDRISKILTSLYLEGSLSEADFEAATKDLKQNLDTYNKAIHDFENSINDTLRKIMKKRLDIDIEENDLD